MTATHLKLKIIFQISRFYRFPGAYASKPFAENGIPKKSVDASLLHLQHLFHLQHLLHLQHLFQNVVKAP